MKYGTVFNIQKFSIHDGPGIRTNVFLKGCPLRCKWCHNPEGLSRESELEFEESKCVYCRKCEFVCEQKVHSFTEFPELKHNIDRSLCILCGKCVEECLPRALKIVGNKMSTDEVIEKVMADKMFYETSGGGITLSGGEPFYQAEFALDILRAAKEKGLNTAVETCGFCSKEAIKEAVSLVDLFLFDYKATGEELHKELTGVSNKVILENLRHISDLGGRITLRCPIIPGANDFEEHFAAIASLAEKTEGIVSVELEAYHSLGVGKSSKIGKVQEFETTAPSDERMKEILEYISSRTSKPVKIS
ncbi:MAG: glycyl-radical enzyme activating protein [Ruminococcaceae bacterium]|nr:glycyl-radical enzyme activating protein [Oscillospiraceae bacterium]